MTTTPTDRRLVALVLTAFGVLVLLPVVLVGGGMMGSMGYGPMMGVQDGMWGGGGVAPGWLFLVAVAVPLLFLAVVGGAGYLLYRAVTGRPDEDDALAALRLAYARGDLDDDEFERRREVLERD